MSPTDASRLTADVPRDGRLLVRGKAETNRRNTAYQDCRTIGTLSGCNAEKNHRNSHHKPTNATAPPPTSPIHAEAYQPWSAVTLTVSRPPPAACSVKSSEAVARRDDA